MVRWGSATAVLLVALSFQCFAATETPLAIGTLNRPGLCGTCHQDIFSMWRKSMHGSSYSDPIFQASYMSAYLETNGEAKKICLRCHAPVAVESGDLDMQSASSLDGITCDYCHSIAAVHLDRNDHPFDLKLDGVKRGPFPRIESPAHKAILSTLHASSELCAGCHEYVNSHGVAVFSTYSEWKAGPFARSKTCQDCHMPTTAGRSVRPGPGTFRTAINLHDISGMHSSEQVRSAASAKLISLRREQPESAVIEVEVANIGSGHAIPTGLPTRKIVLEAIVSCDGREVNRAEKVYQKMLIDEKGELIDVDHRAVLDARSIVKDTRLLPGEHRTERIVVAVPKTGTLSAQIELRYLYEPTLFMKQKISIQIAADSSTGARP